MKASLVYDGQGTITSGGVVHPDFSEEIELIPSPGERVLLVNLDELGIRDLKVEADGLSESSMAEIREATTRFRIDVGSDRLVPRKA